MNKDLNRLNKAELIEIIEEFRSKNTENEYVQKLKNEIQELKNEHKRVLEMFGVQDENEYLCMCVELVGSNTVKKLMEENYKLKKEVQENSRLKKQVQKLKSEQKKIIEEYKENNNVQKIKNERGAGRKSKFTDAQIEKILKDREAGTSIRNIAKFYNCSVGLVHKIINEHKED